MGKLIISAIFLFMSLFSLTPSIHALGSISSTQTPTVSDNSRHQLGNIQIIVNAGSLRAGDALIVSLPQFSSFGSTFSSEVNSDFSNQDNRLVVPNTYNGNTNWDGIQNLFEINQMDKRRIVINSLINQDGNQDLVFYLQFGNIQIDNGSYGAINVNFDTSPGSGFPQGEVKIGKVYGEQTTFSLISSEFQQRENNVQFKLNVKEDQINAVNQNKELKLKLPSGFSWSVMEKPVTIQNPSGDLKIDGNSDREISIKRVNSKEDKALSWEIPLKFTVADQSLVETGDITLDILWDRTSQLTIGSYVKPIDKHYIVFEAGSTAYVSNNVEQQMDVVPYIKDGRTYLPVRFVAEAVGVNEENIIWNYIAKTVTFTASKSVQLKVGSNIILVDGKSIQMDVATEIKDNRVMLPIRYVSEAFDKSINWDDYSKTITIEK